MNQTTHSIAENPENVNIAKTRNDFIKLATKRASKQPLSFYEVVGAMYWKARKGVYQYGCKYLGKLLSYSEDTIERHIKELENQGLIERKGATQKGTIKWELDIKKIENVFGLKETFYPLPIAVISELTTSEKRHVFAFIMRRWNPKKWHEYKITADSSKFIADQLGIDPRTVKQTLDELKEKDYLMKITEYRFKGEIIRDLKNDILKSRDKLTDLYYKAGADSEDDYLIVDELCDCEDSLESEAIDLCQEIEEIREMLHDMLDKLSGIERGIKRQWLAPTGKSKKFFKG